MRAKGEGSICKQSDGRWSARIQVAGRRYQVYGKTRAEAVAKLQELQRTANVGRLPEPTKITLAEYMEEWLTSISPSLRPSTLSDYEIIIRLHITPTLGDVKLTALKPLHLARLYSDLAKKGLSLRRIQMVHARLHKAFADAVKLRLLGSNPADDVTAPKPAYREITVWTRDQAASFLAHAQRYERLHDPLWTFLLGSGCRVGEALALRWADLDLDAGVIHITKSLGFVRNKPIEGPPKTRAGQRSIKVAAFVVDALRTQWRRQATRQLQEGKKIEPNDRVFASSVGTLLQPNNLRREFRASCRASGVPELRIHALRHVHITLAVHSGGSVKDIQRRVGHASLSTTLAIYAKSVPEGDNIVAEGVERLLTAATQ